MNASAERGTVEAMPVDVGDLARRAGQVFAVKDIFTAPGFASMFFV